NDKTYHQRRQCKIDTNNIVEHLQRKVSINYAPIKKKYEILETNQATKSNLRMIKPITKED
ncbi:41961_t:CDS:1, partial [Gigaspora margarita]